MEETIWKEFYETPHHDSQTDDDDEGEIGFSIQVIDSQGNCIAGTDSIDLNILKGEQKEMLSEYKMMDLKGTLLYYYEADRPYRLEAGRVPALQHGVHLG